MFDFAKIGDIGETVTTGLRDMDSRLESIENLLLTSIALQAQSLYVNGAEPDEIIKTIDTARKHAAKYRETLARRAAERAAEAKTDVPY